MPEAVTPPNPDIEGGRVSVPDPTLMTIDALRREIAMLENLIDTRLGAAAELTDTRFEQCHAAQRTAEEQRREQKADTREAVNAALDAQKESTHKMEKSISDQISSLTNNFETSIRGIHSNIADLKDRMTILESVKQGKFAERTEAREVTAGMYATVGVIITVILAVLSVIAFTV